MIASFNPEQGSLLHNMSAPPKSVVKYGGLSDLISTGDIALGVTMYHAAKGMSVALRFELAANVPTKSMSELLRHLNVKPERNMTAQLGVLIDARALELPLPDGCAVLACDSSHRVIWSDTLTVLTILSKCSDCLWLRHKNPSLASALSKRQVSLLVPPLFVSRLPEVLS
jgi:hypothetical protein